jgi:hypothetical protein
MAINRLMTTTTTPGSDGNYAIHNINRQQPQQRQMHNNQPTETSTQQSTFNNEDTAIEGQQRQFGSPDIPDGDT